MKISTGKILLITLLLTAITVAIALYISFNQSKKVNTTFLNVTHTQNVLFNTEKLLVAVSQSEMLAREFVLTNDSEYLTSFNESKTAVKNEFEKLKRNTIDNDLHQKRLDTLEKYIAASIRNADTIVAVSKALLLFPAEGRPVLPLKRIYADSMSSIKVLIRRIQDDEQKLLNERKNASTDAFSNFRTLLFAAFILLVILMVILVQKLRVEVTADRETYRIMQYNTLLMDNIRDAVISTNKNFEIVSWNHVAERSFGWKEEEVKGKSLLFIIRPGQKDEQLAEAVKKLIATGAWDGEISTEKKDGQKISVSVSSAAIRMPDGKIRGTVTLARDVTSRKQLEAQLKRFNITLGKQVEERRAEMKHVVEQLVSSEKKYKQLFENNPLPMMMLSYPELDIVDVNEAALLQYGFSKNDFLRKNIKDIQLSEDMLNFKDYIKENITGYHDAGIWKHRKKDGNIIFVEMFVHGMLVNGLNTKLVLAHDITQKIEAENRQKDHLEQIRLLTGHLQEVREEERKNVARDIHDELGQQLTVLKMGIAWMIRKSKEGDNNVEAGLTNLLGTIDGTMKAVRRICAELRPSVLDDIGLEAAMEWHIKQFSDTTGIAVHFSNLHKDIEVATDIKTTLFRIFQESLTNIARHAEAKTVNVELNIMEAIITMTITDDGKGFDMSVADQKHTLGILGMKERSLAHGGEYTINSKPGKGTSVKVSIPLIAEKEKNRYINPEIRLKT